MSSSSTSTKVKRKRCAPDKKSKEKKKYDDWAASFIKSDTFLATIKAAVQEAVTLALAEVQRNCTEIQKKVEYLEDEMKLSNEKIEKLEKELAAQYEELKRVSPGGKELKWPRSETRDFAEEKERNRSIVILHYVLSSTFWYLCE